MKHLLFLIVSGLFNKDSFSFPFPSPINGLKKKNLSTYPLKNRIRQSICPLRFDIWWERVYIKNKFMITRIKKPAICRTVKSEQNFMLQITVWCGTPWKYLGKEKNSCCSGLHSVAVITPLPKETWGRKSLFSCSSPRSYSTPGVREGLEAGTGSGNGSRDHGECCLLTCLHFGFYVSYAAWPTWLELEPPIVDWTLL